MINILIRKNKRINCEKCKGLFYPQVDDDGSWEISNFEKMSLFDIDEDFKWT